MASRDTRAGRKRTTHVGGSFSDAGIGVDIEDVRRFTCLTREFMERVYTPREISYCLSKAKPEQHFAARFAGKEAVMKALSTSLTKIGYGDIEIMNEAGGRPRVVLGKGYSGYSLLISLSHCEDKAVAFVLGFRSG